ncbi:PIG-P-domain-containing protein [Trametes gibbosa]|nr:PIG-P-domain-containing protein [Trametes gibbosa]
MHDRRHDPAHNTRPASPAPSASSASYDSELDAGHASHVSAQDEPTSPTSPLAPYPPIPPTESRSRAPEFYGFVAWASTYLLFVLYLLWALLPDRAILALGVSWYPNREWALLVPAHGMVAVLFTYLAYFALALARTPAFDDMSTVTDSKAHIAASAAPYRAQACAGAIPEMRDIPLGLVNRVLYGPRLRRARSEHAHVADLGGLGGEGARADGQAEAEAEA